MSTTEETPQIDLGMLAPQPIEEVENPQERIVELTNQLNKLHADVYRIAKREARTHNWCSVVDRALDEAGIREGQGVRTVDLQVEITVTARIAMRVNPDLMLNMSDEEKLNALMEGIEPNINFGSRAGRRTGAVVVPGVDVTYHGKHVSAVRELPPPPPPPTGGGNPPVGYVSRYTGTEGRTLHYVRVMSAGRLPSLYATALCGAYSANGSYGTPSWRETSARAEMFDGAPRVCRACARRS